MRKVINGRVYNTETAEMIAKNGSFNGNFYDYSEELYKTKKGNWFLYGKGGAMSKYAVHEGNGWTSGGSSLLALSEDEAKKTLEDWNEVEVIETHFGEMEEA